MKRPDRRVRAVSSRMSLLAVGERECGRKEEELCEIRLEDGCPARASWAAAPAGVGLEKASCFGGPLGNASLVPTKTSNCTINIRSARQGHVHEERLNTAPAVSSATDAHVCPSPTCKP